MMPPAPPRFSITTGWPRLSCSAGTKLRAAMSVPPPGAAGTMRWIGFVGYCAAAGGIAKCAASSTRERIAIGLGIARRRTNPRLPKKKAQPAERTAYALNSSGDYARMASRSRVAELTIRGLAASLATHASTEFACHRQGTARRVLLPLHYRGHPARLRGHRGRDAATPPGRGPGRDRRVRRIVLPAVGIQMGVRSSRRRLRLGAARAAARLDHRRSEERRVGRE